VGAELKLMANALMWLAAAFIFLRRGRGRVG
jgi:hypothetical protein